MEHANYEQIRLLLDHVWNAGVQYYDIFQWIRFGSDGWGHMARGAGQSVNLEAKFQFSLLEPGMLHLEFFDTPSAYRPERLAFKRTESNASQDVPFDLIPGPHEVACQTMGGVVVRSFPWLLRFGADALPRGYKRGQPLLDYHGRRLQKGRHA